MDYDDGKKQPTVTVEKDEGKTTLWIHDDGDITVTVDSDDGKQHYGYMMMET